MVKPWGVLSAGNINLQKASLYRLSKERTHKQILWGIAPINQLNLNKQSIEKNVVRLNFT